MAKIISTNGSISTGMAIGAAVASALNDVGVNPGLLQRTYENVVRNGGTATITGPNGTAQVIPESRDYSGSTGFTPMSQEDLEKDPLGKFINDNRMKIFGTSFVLVTIAFIFMSFDAASGGNYGGAAADIVFATLTTLFAVKLYNMGKS